MLITLLFIILFIVFIYYLSLYYSITHPVCNTNVSYHTQNMLTPVSERDTQNTTKHQQSLPIVSRCDSCTSRLKHNHKTQLRTANSPQTRATPASSRKDAQRAPDQERRPNSRAVSDEAATTETRAARNAKCAKPRQELGSRTTRCAHTRATRARPERQARHRRAGTTTVQWKPRGDLRPNGPAGPNTTPSATAGGSSPGSGTPSA